MNFLETTIINTFIFTFPILIYLLVCKNFSYERINPNSYGKWTHIFTSFSFVLLSIIFIVANLWFLIYFWKDYTVIPWISHILLIFGLLVFLTLFAIRKYGIEKRLDEIDEREIIITDPNSDDTVKNYYPEKRYRKEFVDKRYNNVENIKDQYRRNKRLDDIDERNPDELRKLTKKYNI